jgi:hypothetical protein
VLANRWCRHVRKEAVSCRPLGIGAYDLALLQATEI